MKIFAIQKTQTNTYSSQYQQNNSINQNPFTKTNNTGDKFVSKVAFGASIRQMESQLAELKTQLSKVSGKALEDLNRQISELEKTLKKENRRLDNMIEGLHNDDGPNWEP